MKDHNMETVSGNILFTKAGLRPENYFIQGPGMDTGLDTIYLTPEDLRKLADHLENLRLNKTNTP